MKLKFCSTEVSKVLSGAARFFFGDQGFGELTGLPAAKYLKRRLKAFSLAAGPKRLDACASQFSHWLWLLKEKGFASKSFLRGAACLEVGSGWVLSHALICHLLGASKVLCTDVEAHAFPAALATAVGDSNQSLIRDILSPFETHHLLRQRLDALFRNGTSTFDALRKIKIEYRAPFDYSESLETEPLTFDFIYSNSVLEHVPSDQVGVLLQSLSKLLKPGGVMLHCIHLEDHLDLSRPFDFLSEPAASFGALEETVRGNRIRASKWANLANDLVASDRKASSGSDGSSLEWDFIYSWSRPDRHLPLEIDPVVVHMGEDDLRVSHLGLAVRKIPRPEPSAAS